MAERSESKRNSKNKFMAIGAGESIAVPASSTVTFEASICIRAARIHTTSTIVNETALLLMKSASQEQPMTQATDRSVQ